jgi:cytochrome oxidase Cu insertion factor (SCO1/SenC/PrrC family)
MLNKKLYILAFVLILLIGLFTGLRFLGGTTTAISLPEKSQIALTVPGLMEAMNIRRIDGEQFAPDFRLKSLDGEWIQLSNFRGQVVLLSFWATW